MELKIMTFNLRCECDDDGINHWKYRTDLVRRAILDEGPDIIGFQEVTRNMARDVTAMLSEDYIVIGTGRDKNYSGEGVNIAFKKELFDLISLDTFWLSDTPDVPGSRYESLDQSVCPRISIIAGLTLKNVGKKIYFCNTHLDHVGEKARVEGAKLMLSRLSNVCTFDDTIIITGDLNAYPSSQVIPTFCDKTLGISDITDGITSTFHAWGKKRDINIKIDYIFTNAEKSKKTSYTVTKYEENGVFCSDHYPVCGFVIV